MNVRDIMAKQVACCTPQQTLDVIVNMMQDNDCGSIPITDDDGRALGILTDRDIALTCAEKHKALWELCGEDFINGHSVFTCSDDDDVRTALETMRTCQVRRLPVVNRLGHIEGILSIDDIITFAQRGIRGEGSPDISYEDTMTTLKALCNHH